jgi:hypothetical protein
MNITARRAAAGLASAAALALALTACQGSSTGSSQSSENNTSSQDLYTYQQAQPAPHFPYSVLRQELIAIEASQAVGEETTSFFFNQGVQDPIFSCPSIGDPVPNTAELTNPSKVQTAWGQGPSSVAIGNIDPNGIYAPTNSTGTNVMCVNSAGTQYLQYWEGFVDTVNGSAHWDAGKHQVVVTGAPNMPSCSVATEKYHGHKQPVTDCKK